MCVTLFRCRSVDGEWTMDSLPASWSRPGVFKNLEVLDTRYSWFIESELLLLLPLPLPLPLLLLLLLLLLIHCRHFRLSKKRH